MLMKLVMYPTFLAFTPLGNHTFGVTNASIKTLLLCWCWPLWCSAVCTWVRTDNPARWTVESRRWSRCRTELSLCVSVICGHIKTHTNMYHSRPVLVSSAVTSRHTQTYFINEMCINPANRSVLCWRNYISSISYTFLLTINIVKLRLSYFVGFSSRNPSYLSQVSTYISGDWVCRSATWVDEICFGLQWRPACQHNVAGNTGKQSNTGSRAHWT